MWLEQNIRDEVTYRVKKLISVTFRVVGGPIWHDAGILILTRARCCSVLCHSGVEKKNGDMFSVEWTKVTGLPPLKRTNTSYKTSIDPSCRGGSHDPMAAH